MGNTVHVIDAVLVPVVPDVVARQPQPPVRLQEELVVLDPFRLEPIGGTSQKGREVVQVDLGGHVAVEERQTEVRGWVWAIRVRIDSNRTRGRDQSMTYRGGFVKWRVK